MVLNLSISSYTLWLACLGLYRPGLIAHVKDETATQLLEGLSEAIAETPIPDTEFRHPGTPFVLFDERLFPNLDSEAKRFLLRMLNLGPNERATMAQILEDPYLQEVEKLPAAQLYDTPVSQR